VQEPPPRSQGIFHDLYHFLARRAPIDTLMEVADAAARADFEGRIRQRLGISAEEYAVLNIHRIGIDAPLRLVFEELLTWHDASVWWPNHLAAVHRVDGSLEDVRMLLFGTPLELFRLHAVRIRRDPGPQDLDSVRYVLYETSGGYPIGIFGMFVRSRIADRGETEPTQVFFAVGFNFYGKRNWPHRRLLNPIWEWVHNRASSNILNRFKRLCEAAFQKLSG
jgi:hypothetical protein